jgi:hypothetical protein
VISIVMIVCPPIAIVYMDSYYATSMIHAMYIWVLIVMSMGVFESLPLEEENKKGFIFVASNIHVT